MFSMVATATQFATTPVAVSTGWTWAATMGAIQNLLIAGGGAGIGGLLIKAIVQLRRIGNERAKQDNERDSGRWSELMDLNERLQKRIERLEADVREERKRSDDEVSAIRKSHVEEVAAIRREHDVQIRAFNERIDQLQRTIIQGQVTTARMIDSNVAPTTAAMIDKMIEERKP